MEMEEDSILEKQVLNVKGEKIILQPTKEWSMDATSEGDILIRCKILASK